MNKQMTKFDWIAMAILVFLGLIAAFASGMAAYQKTIRLNTIERRLDKLEGSTTTQH